MNLLAIDTSTEYLSVVLQTGEQVHAFEVLAGQKHAELTLPTVRDLAQQAGIELAQLDGIALAVGPGSFTGLRIGCGIVQGMAFGLGKPVFAVNSLAALAAGFDAPRILAITDARMGELYVAGFEWRDGELIEILPTQVCKPDALPDLPAGDCLGCGSGFLVQADALQARYGQQLAGIDAQAFPHARGVLRLAQPAFAAGKGIAADQLELLYIRNKVALTAIEQAALRKS